MNIKQAQKELALILSDGLTPKHFSAISLLTYSSKTKKEIAKELNISEQTLYNWLSNPVFQKQMSMQVYLRFTKTNEELGKAYIDFVKAIYTSQREILETGTTEQKLDLIKTLAERFDFTQIPQTQVQQSTDYSSSDTKSLMNEITKQIMNKEKEKDCKIRK